MRTEFEMSDADLKGLLEACTSTPLVMLQCGMPPSPQERANLAWKALGDRMGFDSMSVKPIPGKSQHFFSAVATRPPAMTDCPVPHPKVDPCHNCVPLSDTDRLNWLATHPRGAEIVIEGKATPCVFWGISAAPEVTLREAIDAAIRSESAGPGA